MRFSTRFRLTTLALSLTLCLVLAGTALAASRGISVKTKAGKQINLYKGSYALLVGVSNYTAGWPKLESIPREVNAVAEVLKAQGFQVKTVIDPNGKQLEQAFENFVDNYGYDADNCLLFFYSGHGFTRKNGRLGYLVPTDAPLPNRDLKGFLRKSLTMNRIMSWCRGMEAKHALFLFDSCFSGTVFKAKSAPVPKYISTKTARPVRQFISAGSAKQEVPAQSVFAPSFVRGVQGEADRNKDGYVTGSELGEYLLEKVPYYNEAQTPQYGKIRDPNLDEGDFVFLLAGGPGPTPKAKLPPPPPEPPKGPDTEGLKALKERAKRKAAWDAWQQRMNSYWREVESIDSSSLSAKEKAEAWDNALHSFQDDNPFSAEDESLRKRARERLGYWKDQATAAARAAGEAKVRADAARKEHERAKACPDCLAAPSGKRTCSADFSARANGLTVRFQDESKDPDGIARSMAYSFGDGKVGYIQKGGAVSHSYAKAGSYSVTLRYKSGPTGGSYCYARKTVEVTSPKAHPKADKRFTKGADGVITDHQTGLQWYLGPDRNTNWYEAKKWVKNLTVAGGGWRMPTTVAGELRGLYQKGKGSRNIDPIFTFSGWYVWTAEPRGASDAWTFFFDFGFDRWAGKGGGLNGRAFAVRGNPPKSVSQKSAPVVSNKKKPEKTAKLAGLSSDGRFNKGIDGVITDHQTGLQWYVGPDKDTNWNDAKKWVKSLKVAGGGWRMPNHSELKKLYQKGEGSRNMDPIFKVNSWWVWSGETKGPSCAWGFSFYHIGQKDWRDRIFGNDLRVFAVRSRR